MFVIFHAPSDKYLKAVDASFVEVDESKDATRYSEEFLAQEALDKSGLNRQHPENFQILSIDENGERDAPYVPRMKY